MANTFTEQHKSLLDPVARVSEIIFGLIMALTFTGSISVASAGHEEIQLMLVGAIGCNLAWGLVDATMYLITTVTERSRDIAMLRAVRTASVAADAHQIIANALPPVVASILSPAEFEALRGQLQRVPEPPLRPQLHRDDFLSAAAICLLVFLSTLPVVIPFVCMQNALRALRVSNGIAILMLFIAGVALGRHAGGQHPWRMGLVMVVVGSVLVLLTIALGG